MPVDVDNAFEPALGDAVPVEVRPHSVMVPVPMPTSDEHLTHCRAVCMANGWLPLRAEEHERLVRLERDNEHLRAVGRAYQETAVARAERIDELEEQARPALDRDLVVALLSRAAREIDEPRARAAFVEDVDGAIPGFAEQLPDRVRPRRG